MSVRAILERSCALGGDVVWRSLHQLYLGWRQQQLIWVSSEADSQFQQQLSQLTLPALSQELVSRELSALARSQLEIDDADIEGFLRRILARIGSTRLDAATRQRLETLEALLSRMAARPF